VAFRFLRGWRWVIVLAVFALAFIVVASLPATFSDRIERRFGPAAAALARFPAKGSIKLRHGGQQVVDMWMAAEENRVLKEELAVIRIEKRRLEELVRRETKNRKALEFKGRTFTRLEPVRLLARDPASWFNAFTLDAGSDQDIALGSGVVNEAGVVGKVNAVRAGYSKAVFLVDPGCRLTARDARSAVDCVAVGNGRGAVLLEYLKGQDDVRVGDLIETAAGGLTFPTGVPIGKVVRVEKKESGMVLSALVEPVADLKKLGSLYVMRKR
jgi:rod shape-determining protein MreC